MQFNNAKTITVTRTNKLIANGLICVLIFGSQSPLLGTEVRYLVLALIALIISRFKVRANSKLFSVHIFLIISLLLLLSLVAMPAYFPPFEHWKFIGIFLSMLISSIFILDSVGLNRLLKVNFYFVSYTCAVTVPIFILYRFGLIDALSFWTYEYGGYESKTLIFLNIHMYLDGSLSGRFVSFGSEPGISQLSWIFAVYYGLKHKLSVFLIVAVVLAIILGRSPIGTFFVVMLFSTMLTWRSPTVVLAAILGISLIYFSIDWRIFSDQTGVNKLSGSYLPDRFSRESLMLDNYFHYFLPGGVYELYPSSIRRDFLGFGGVSQLVQRFGLIFTVVFLSLPLIGKICFKNILLAAFLMSTLITQSVFLNPFFFCLWLGIFYYDSDLPRILYSRKSSG